MYDVINLNEKIDTLIKDLNLFEFKTEKLETIIRSKKWVSLVNLINSPEILLLDEPTASLDLIQAIRRTYIEEYALNTDYILLASHNMNEVERLCSEVMMMKSGIIIDKGTCESLISKHGRKNLEQTFLKLVEIIWN